MAAIALQPARTPAVHASLFFFTFQTANWILPRRRLSPWPRPGADRFSLVRGSGAPLACAAARGGGRTGLRPLQRGLGSLAPSRVAMAGLRRRPRPTTNSCLSEEAFGTGQNGGANDRDGNPCRVFQGRRSSFFSSALPQAASGPGGAGSRSLGAWRERRGALARLSDWTD